MALNTQRMTGEDIQKAAQLLRAFELVVFPTETVYGLGAMADSDAAVAKIYTAKGRPADNPLIVHVGDIGMASMYAERIQDIEAFLFNTFAPGPLSLIVQRRPERAAAAAAGLSTIALRIPSSPVIRAIIEAVGSGIAAPSANRSGRPSPTDFTMAWHEMNGRVSGIIEAGPSEKGIESTVLRCLDNSVQVLRPGSISREIIQRAVRGAGFSHDVVSSPRSTGQTPEGAVVSPGSKYRHYAPRNPISLYTSSEELESRVRELWHGEPVPLWIIAPGKNFAPRPQGASALPDTSPNTSPGTSPGTSRRVPAAAATVETVEDYSRRLYRLFHSFDQRGQGHILAYLPCEVPETEALRDRLLRAAAAPTGVTAAARAVAPAAGQP